MKNKKKMALFLVVALCLQVTGCGKAVSEVGTNQIAGAIISAEYPEMAKYPDTNGWEYDKEEYVAWRASRAAQEPENTEYQDGMKEFYLATIPAFLDGDDGGNRIYSPLNIYMALAMLAETTAGESRNQILKLLHTDSIESLRVKSKTLWNANYCDDGTVTSLLASSVWLSDTLQYNKAVLETLADTYYASSFSGEMGSVELNKSLRDWLNANTGDLLKEQTVGVGFNPLTIFALATTVNFKAKWAEEFKPSKTAEDTFYAVSGELTCEFMKQSDTDRYYWGENFSAVVRRLENSGNMILILPDEGIMAEALLNDAETLEFMLNYRNWENSKTLTINQAIPKFDVVSDIDFRKILKTLGVTDVLTMENANFTPITMEPGVYLQEAKHATRVMIDEEGCQAAAYTVLEACGSSMPPEEKIDFVLNRPFLFVLNGQDGQPLFIGIVNQP